MPALREARYDWHHIYQQLRRVLRDEGDWQAFFLTINQEPCRVLYEDARRDRDEALRRILAYCGVSADASFSGTADFGPEPQSGTENSAWMSCFLEEAPWRLQEVPTPPVGSKAKGQERPRLSLRLRRIVSPGRWLGLASNK
jgi:LPS sulfotransferase NodH